VSLLPLIRFENVTKSYLGKEPVLDEISLKIDAGEFLFLTGISGAGKSTIFRLLMGLEIADSGQVLFNGGEVSQFNRRKLAVHRRAIGMVFQDYKLLRKKSAQENIEVPLQINGISNRQRVNKIHEIADTLKIKNLLDQNVESLSGGEQQLVAIARAAVHYPKVILADEPTANLDQKMANLIIEMLSVLNRSGITVVVATHNVDLIKAHRRRILLLKKANLFEVEK